MLLLIVVPVLACVPAMIAKSKGRSFALWWLYGLALFIIALTHALLLKDDPQSNWHPARNRMPVSRAPDNPRWEKSATPPIDPRYAGARIESDWR
ncbi:MAG: hypothetical protein P4L90_04435 [Rhodopila sp.]|nr:hypothetical protein [Rhodopila sp.]